MNQKNRKMKKLYLVFILSLFGFIACNQANKDVPQNVFSAFSQKFPGATKIKWDQENEKEWEAEFKMDGKDYSANFDHSGAWLETEYAISDEEIPAAVKTTLEKEFGAYNREESEISETKDGIMLEFGLKKDGEFIEVSIDMNGKTVKKEEVKEEREEEED
jgi:hypothetical protein